MQYFTSVKFIAEILMCSRVIKDCQYYVYVEVYVLFSKKTFYFRAVLYFACGLLHVLN